MKLEIPFKDKQDWSVEKICKNCFHWCGNTPFLLDLNSDCADDDGNKKACGNFRPPLKPLYQKMEMKNIEHLLLKLDKLFEKEINK